MHGVHASEMAEPFFDCKSISMLRKGKQKERPCSRRLSQWFMKMDGADNYIEGIQAVFEFHIH